MDPIQVQPPNLRDLFAQAQPLQDPLRVMGLLTFLFKDRDSGTIYRDLSSPRETRWANSLMHYSNTSGKKSATNARSCSSIYCFALAKTCLALHITYQTSSQVMSHKSKLAFTNSTTPAHLSAPHSPIHSLRSRSHTTLNSARHFFPSSRSRFLCISCVPCGNHNGHCSILFSFPRADVPDPVTLPTRWRQ